MNEQFQKSISNLMDKMGGWLDAFILALPNIFLAIVFLAVAYFTGIYLKKIVEKYLKKAFSNKTVASLLTRLFMAFFILLVLFIILNILDLSDALTALLGTAGVAGLAIGFALQDPMINLFSGVQMSVRDYYKLGDLVEIDEYFGIIHKINLRSTILRTLDGQEIVIPNKEVLQNPLTNYSNNPRRRIEIPCGVSYEDDLLEVKEVATEAIRNCDFSKEETDPIDVFFTGFGDSSINFTLRFWKNINTQEDYLIARDKAIIALKHAFDKHKISIPFPIRTLDFGLLEGQRMDKLYPPGQTKPEHKAKQ